MGNSERGTPRSIVMREGRTVECPFEVLRAEPGNLGKEAKRKASGLRRQKGSQRESLGQKN